MESVIPNKQPAHASVDANEDREEIGMKKRIEFLEWLLKITERLK